MLKDRTPYPDWAAPFTAIWFDGEWIVQFPNEDDAKDGLRIMRENEGCLLLHLARMPNMSAYWYVGIAD